MSCSNKLFLNGVAAMVFLVAAGCDQDVNVGKLDSGKADAGAADLAAADASSRDQGDAQGGDLQASDAVQGKTVKVTYAGKSPVVSLTKPTSVTFEGTLHARLSDLVALALPGKDQSKLQADFESSDGFRSSKKSTCNGLVPVAGSLFVQGYVDINTRKLRWDTALKHPGCLYVKDLAIIILTDK